MFTFQTNFRQLLLKGEGGGVNPLVEEVTVNGKEANS